MTETTSQEGWKAFLELEKKANKALKQQPLDTENLAAIWDARPEEASLDEIINLSTQLSHSRDLLRKRRREYKSNTEAAGLSAGEKPQFVANNYSHVLPLYEELLQALNSLRAWREQLPHGHAALQYLDKQIRKHTKRQGKLSNKLVALVNEIKEYDDEIARHAAEYPEHKGWVLVESLGSGTHGNVRLYVRQNAFGVIVDRVAAKDSSIATLEASQLNDSKTIPNEITAMYSLRPLIGSDCIVQIHNHSLQSERGSYTIYTEYCGLGTLEELARMYGKPFDEGMNEARRIEPRSDHPDGDDLNQHEKDQEEISGLGEEVGRGAGDAEQEGSDQGVGGDREDEEERPKDNSPQQKIDRSFWIPEPFIWAQLEQLCIAGLLMERGDLEGTPTEWSLILHRDIRLPNICLRNNTGETYRGYPLGKLGNFATSAIIPPGEQASWAHYRLVNSERAHTAPELCIPELHGRGTAGPRLTSKANVWAVGDLIWSLITLRDHDRKRSSLPRNNNPPELVHEDFDEEAQAKYSKELRELVMRCVGYSPDERPSFDQLLRKIRRNTGDGGKRDYARGLRNAPAGHGRFNKYALRTAREEWMLRMVLAKEWAVRKSGSRSPPPPPSGNDSSDSSFDGDEENGAGASHGNASPRGRPRAGGNNIQGQARQGRQTSRSPRSGPRQSTELITMPRREAPSPLPSEEDSDSTGLEQPPRRNRTPSLRPPAASNHPSPAQQPAKSPSKRRRGARDAEPPRRQPQPSATAGAAQSSGKRPAPTTTGGKTVPDGPKPKKQKTRKTSMERLAESGTIIGGQDGGRALRRRPR
ncbi:hypothetical protein D0861_03905 [Lecanosticta acicola]|uniref:non-specific serine/threonine protein kinase n=1 Tax=Lecanosticta acicola TaxID=111012 RepID=A0AAI8YR70_9PEZI|nr:hypothetical protein D0861_03905 [Lecanosticta acicola]